MDWIEELQQYHADAMSVAVVRDYRIAKAFAVGGAVTPHTRFQAASISKMVSTLAVLRFVAEGKLSLDDDVSRHLGDLHLLRADGSPAKATVRQLLSHTAGFNVSGFDGYGIGERVPTTAQILAGEEPCNSPKIAQEHEPGERWIYSGGGFMVLQRCLENISGMSFAEMMEQCILGPLGMANSTFAQDVTENLAEGYSDGKAVADGHNIMPEQAAAGLWTSATDLARLGIHLQSILRGDSGLIPKMLIDEMVTPHVLTPMGEACYSGLGCYLNTFDGIAYFGHAGDNIGFESEVNFSLQGGNGYCILVNSDDAYPLIEKLGEQLRNTPSSDLETL